MNARRIIMGACVPCLLAISPSVADDAPLGLADLDAYRQALQSRPGPAPRVGFRDLWDRPGAYLGRPVRVEGRVARVFRQPGLGEFPPLAEAWVVSPAGDPICLVFPAPEGRPTASVGALVRFSGTFLKRLRYRGGDVDRLAPLIVGPEPPSAPASSTPPTEGPSWSAADWAMGLVAASAVALMLARRHLARPDSPPADRDPPPRFVDGEPGPAFEDDPEGSAHEHP